MAQNSSRVASVRKLLLTAPLEPTPAQITPIPLLPNAVMPAITIREGPAKELENLEGLSGLIRTAIQIDCWSKSYEEAWALRESVSRFLLFNALGGSGDNVIRSVNHQLSRELHDAQRELHQCILQLWVWWESSCTRGSE